MIKLFKLKQLKPLKTEVTELTWLPKKICLFFNNLNNILRRSLTLRFAYHFGKIFSKVLYIKFNIHLCNKLHVEIVSSDKLESFVSKLKYLILK